MQSMYQNYKTIFNNGNIFLHLYLCDGLCWMRNIILNFQIQLSIDLLWQNECSIYAEKVQFY